MSAIRVVITLITIIPIIDEDDDDPDTFPLGNANELVLMLINAK